MRPCKSMNPEVAYCIRTPFRRGDRATPITTSTADATRNPTRWFGDFESQYRHRYGMGRSLTMPQRRSRYDAPMDYGRRRAGKRRACPVAQPHCIPGVRICRMQNDPIRDKRQPQSLPFALDGGRARGLLVKSRFYVNRFPRYAGRESLDDIAKDHVTHTDRRADGSGQNKVDTDDHQHGCSLGNEIPLHVWNTHECNNCTVTLRDKPGTVTFGTSPKNVGNDLMGPGCLSTLRECVQSFSRSYQTRLTIFPQLYEE